MSQNDNRPEDEMLRELFRDALPPVGDDGFSDAVMRRVRRTGRIRKRVLYAAASVGIAVAAWPAGQVLAWLGRRVTELTVPIEALTGSQSETLIFALCLGLLSPLLIAFLED